MDKTFQTVTKNLKKCRNENKRKIIIKLLKNTLKSRDFINYTISTNFICEWIDLIFFCLISFHNETFSHLYEMNTIIYKKISADQILSDYYISTCQSYISNVKYKDIVKDTKEIFSASIVDVSNVQKKSHICF